MNPMHRHTIASAPECQLRAEILSNEAPIPRESSETPAGLLATASAVLDTDLHAAKIYMGRAAALLGLDLVKTPPAAPARSRRRGGLAPWQAKRLRTYIADHLASRIRAPDLAAMVQLSTSHFFRAFRETFGQTPLAYIMKQRVLCAQELMLSSSRSIAEIALDCGMCDQPHFTRVFRRIVGVSPRDWRRTSSARIDLPPEELADDVRNAGPK